MAFNRQDAIQGALELGQSAQQISRGLQSINQKPLNDYEVTLIQRDRYGLNPVERWAQGAKEFASGLSTLGGAIGQYGYNPIFRDYVNRGAINYGKDVLKGQRSPFEDFTNMVLSPYGVNVNEVFREPLKSAKTAGLNALADPFNATLDAAMFVPKGGLAKVASKIVPDVPVLGDIRKGLLPTNAEKAVNEVLNLSKAKYAPQSTLMRNQLEELSLNPKIEDAVKNLTYGTTSPPTEELTNQLRNFGRQINEEMVRLGVDPGDAKKVAVGQFVLENVDPNRTSKVYIQNIQKAIDNPTTDNIKALGLKSPQELTNLVERASKLYDEGRIFPITQRGITSANDATLVDLTNIGKGLSTERTFGYATPQEVAKNLDRGYNQLYREIEEARLAQDNFQEIAQKFGRGITKDELAKIGKNEVVISPTEFKEGVKTLFNQGKQADIPSELGKIYKQTLSKGIAPSTLTKYANDLYVLPKSDLKAFTNYFQGYDKTSGLGRFINATKPIMGAFKSSVLAKMPYVVGNRIGNYSLGAIGGADYATALTPGMIANYVPDYIKFSTSLHGINPGFESRSPLSTFKQTTKNIERGIETVRDTNLTPLERTAGVGNVVNEAQGYITKPLFQSESTLELIDRAAVYFNQAKKEAQATGQTMKEVLDKALTDQELQRKLIGNVNSVLGDYLGRNYSIDPTLYELGSLAFPFQKVITTSKDVLTNQLRDNPLRLQAFTRNPARIGNELERIDAEVGGQPTDNDMRGGIVTKPTYSRMYPAQKMFNDYNPLIAPFETLQSIIGPEARRGEGTGVAGAMNVIAGNLSPIAGFFNAMQGEDQYGNQPIGPNTYKVGGKLITLDNNGNRLEAAQPNQLGAFSSYIGRNFLPLATLYNQTIGPTIGAYTGNGFYQPTNRSILGSFANGPSIPYLMEGNTNKMPIDNKPDLDQSQFGFKKREVYYPYTETMGVRDLQNALKRRTRNELLQLNRRR